MQCDNLNVFDLDGTIINVNSFKEISKKLAFALCQKLQIARLFELILWYFIRKLNIICHLKFKKRVVDIFEKSLTEEEKQDICQIIFDNNINKAVFEKMINLDNCIVCTASPFAYVSRISFNKNIVIIGSLDPKKSYPDPANFGTGKIENIRAYFDGQDIRIINCYTNCQKEDQALIDFSVNAFVYKNGRLAKVR